MMEVDDNEHEFNRLFHNLKGSTFDDRKKSFFCLLNQTSKNSTPEQIDSSLDNLQPKNYLEELFKIDALIYFHKTSKLLDILKGGNVVFINKVIKHSWFFQEAFKNISEEEFVNDFLPDLSFSLRMKVLHRLSVSLNEAQMDDVFDCVLKRYGLFIASHIVSACSVKKIETTLRTKEVKLWSNQLKALFHKNPKLLILYFEQHKIIRDDYDKLFSYIAQKNPELFWELRRKFTVGFELRIGKRTTKRLVDLKRNEIISNVEEYLSIFRKGVMVRRLRGQFPKMYQQIFPKVLDKNNINHYHVHIELLKLYPKKRRWDIFSETFQKMYGKNIYENLTLLDESFVVSIFGDKELQLKWAEEKYKETHDNFLLRFYETKVSIPLLKQKINLTTKKDDRSRLLDYMVISCAMHDDMVCLEEVLKYFWSRHRNEDFYVGNSFIASISGHINLEKLNETHWNYINEYIDSTRTKNKFTYTRFLDFIQKYLIFLYKNCKPTTEATAQFMKDAITVRCPSFRVKPSDAQIEREILINVIRILSQEQEFTEKKKYARYAMRDIIDFNKETKSDLIYLSDYKVFEEVTKTVFDKSEQFEEEDVYIIRNVLLYNWHCPEKQIFAYSDQKLLQILSRIYEENENSYLLKGVIPLIVGRPNRNKLENDVLDLYFNELMERNADYDVLSYFISKEPETLVQYYHKILEPIDKFILLSFPLIKKFSYLDLDKKTIEYYKTQLAIRSKSSQKMFIIEAFSKLMNTDEYVLFIKDNYLPKRDKLDLSNKIESELYKLQCHAVNMLKNIQEPYKAVSVLLKFCVGDYLQESIPTLYRTFYLTPEKLLLPHIQTLSKRAVSVRKHALFLACELLEQEKTIILFKVAVETEKNLSSQKHLLSAALKYFQKIQSIEVFNLFISNINFTDKMDGEFLKTLPDISKIPSCYKPLYVKKIWEFFEKIGNENVNIREYQNSLLSALDKDIASKMDVDFCKRIIKTYFLKVDIHNMDKFIYYFISTHDEQENLDTIFEFIRESKKESTDLIFNFFNTFFTSVRDDKDKVLAAEFKQRWEQVFTIQECFEHIALLNLSQLYYECNEDISDKFATKVNEYLEQLITTFSPHVTYLFATPFIRFFKITPEMYTVLLSMLKSKPIVELYILAHEIIKNCEDSQEYDAIKEIKNHLKNCEYDVIQTLYCQYITANY